MFWLLNDFNLIGFDLALTIFGIAYAIYIYYWPFKTGWTWVSVGIGVGITILVDVLVRQTVLSRTGYSAPRFLPYTTLVAFVETGGPMIVGQVIKLFWQAKENGELENLFKSNGDNHVH